MIKTAIILVLAFAVCFLAIALVYDSNVIPSDAVIEDLKNVESVIENFESQLESMGISKETISNAIERVKEYNESAEYIIAVEIQNVNTPILKTTLHLPANETIYSSVNIGDILTEEYLASLGIPTEYLTGWTVTIVNKGRK